MIKIITATLFILFTTTAVVYAFQTPPATWAKFTPPAGHFSIQMPGRPEENKSTTNEGGPLSPFTTFLYTAKTEQAIYLIGWVDYKPGTKLDVQGELAANRDNFIKGVQAKVISEKPIKLGTHPGIEFTAESAQASFISRVYIVGQRPFQLIAVTRIGVDDGPNREKFFSSFDLAPAR